MRWARRRLHALACCLLPGALAADVQHHCADGVALLQLDSAAQHQAESLDRLKPKHQMATHRNQLEPLMLDMSEPAAQQLNTSKLYKSIWGRSAHEDPFQAMMRFMSVLFTAVRKETFMKAVNDLTKSTSKVITEFKEKSTQLATDFDLALQGELSEDQLVRLTGEYFLKEAHLMNTYYQKRIAINQRSTRIMPSDVAASLEQVMAAMEFEEAVDATNRMTVDVNSGVQGFCHEVVVIMDNITEMDKGMADAKKRINGTQKMESTLKNYLSTLKPELVPRIIWVLNQFLDMEYSGAETINEVNEVLRLHVVDPVLIDRLACMQHKGQHKGHRSRSASAPQRGGHLLPGLLLVGQVALLLGRPLAWG